MTTDPSSDKCDPVKFIAPTAKIGGTVKVPPCLPAPPTIPDRHITPPGVPSGNPFPEVIKPAPLIVGNDYTEAICPDPSKGEVSRIEAFVYTSLLVWESIDGMTEDVLIVIQGKGGDYEKFFEAYTAGELTVEFLKTWIGALPDLAQSIIDAFYAIQNSLNTQAQYAAEAALQCLFYSEEVTEECPPGVATPDEYNLAVISVTVPAGRFTSTVSVADATSKATAYAKSLLVCMYTNGEIEVDCQDILGFPDEIVPVDKAPVYPGLPRRVGRYKVASLFFSAISKLDADAKARAYAMSMLSCFYINKEVVLTCDPANGDAYPSWANNPDLPPEVANLETLAKGQTVIIPEGAVTSLLGTADATNAATELAKSLLECCYLNKAYTAECPPQTVRLPSGELVTVPADPNASKPASYTIAAGTINSCVGQAEADELAENYAHSVLQCSYCNTIVLPLCVPNWVTVGVEAGTIALPLDLKTLIDPGTGKPVDFSKWSISSTLGTPAGVYCSGDYLQSQTVADSTGSVTVDSLRKGDGCVFLSDEIIVGCSVADPYTNRDVPYLFYSKYAPGSFIAKESTPPARSYVTLAAGAVSATAANVPYTKPDTYPNYQDVNAALTKQYVNEKAMELAKSLLNCWFTNSITEVSCDSPRMTTGTDVSLWEYGAGKYSKNLTKTSPSQLRPAIVPYGMIVSYLSLEDVGNMTNQFAQSILICQYFNDAQSAQCPSGLSSTNAGQIGEGAFIGNSLEEANSLAAATAASMLSCIDESAMGGGGDPGKDGAPGPPGAQENCTGQCYGYLS